MNTLIVVIIISAILLALCFAGLALNILVKKNGKFPETEVGSNKNMRRMGITCTKQEEISRWKKQRKAVQEHDCGACAGCTCGLEG